MSRLLTQLWSHITPGGVCWMTDKELKNKEKIALLHENTDLFRETYPDLFSKLMTSRGTMLNTSKMRSGCINFRSNYKTGIWNTDSSECEGLYNKQVELLNMIGFRWEGGSE